MAPTKPNPDKLDGDWRDDCFLGVIWKSGDYVVGTAEGVSKCSTIKTRPIGNAHDPSCIDYVTTSYDDFILKGAKPEGANLRFAPNATTIAATPILARGGSELAPRRMYLMPSDVVRPGYTIGETGSQQQLPGQNGEGTRGGRHGRRQGRI